MTARKLQPADVTELLAAVRDALAYPQAASTRDDMQTRDILAETRRVSLHATLAALLNDPLSDVMVRWAADTIREGTARYPVTYTPWTSQKDLAFAGAPAVVWDAEQHVHLLDGHHTDPDEINAVLATALAWTADAPDRELLIPGATETGWALIHPGDDDGPTFTPATAVTPGAIPVTWVVTYALGDALDGFVPDYAADPAAALEEAQWLRRSGFLAAVQPSPATA